MEKNLKIVMDKVDILILGSGPGGYVAAIRAAQLGLSVSVAEKDDLGGVCLNWGCIPTKALLKSAQALHYSKNSKEYGVEISGDVKPDISAIVARSRGVAGNMSRGVEYLFKKNGVNLIKGFASIVSPGEVKITADDGSVQHISAKHIL